MSEAEDPLVDRILFTLEDGRTVVVRERRSTIEGRRRILRNLALYYRATMLHYERGLPPKEFRTWADNHAHATFAAKLGASVVRDVVRLDALVPCGSEWREANEAVAELSYDECAKELATLPNAP